MAALSLFPELVFKDIESIRSVYLRKAKRLFLEIALERGSVSLDDVRELLELPDELNPKCNGEVANHFQRLRYISHMDWIRSRRPIAHRRPIVLWKLIDRVGAEQWLRDNPDLDSLPGYESETPSGAALDGVT